MSFLYWIKNTKKKKKIWMKYNSSQWTQRVRKPSHFQIRCSCFASFKHFKFSLWFTALRQRQKNVKLILMRITEWMNEPFIDYFFVFIFLMLSTVCTNSSNIDLFRRLQVPLSKAWKLEISKLRSADQNKQH